jgi:DNA-binding response OmpR family regulator
MDVLVVDDHEYTRQLVGMTLEPRGHSVRYAVDAAAAVDELLRRPPDVALVDVSLPGPMDGLQLCKYMKSMPSCAGKKVVLLSARTQADDIKAGGAAGADLYVTKPFSPLELARNLEALC